MGNNLLIFIPLWGGLIAFMMISGRRRKKKEQEKLDSLKEGAEILTIGGIRGTIVKMNDSYADIKVAKGVIMTFRKTAIAGPIQVTSSTEPEKTLEDSEAK